LRFRGVHIVPSNQATTLEPQLIQGIQYLPGQTLKHEDVYLKGYADGRELHEGLADWIAFYNNRRPHQALRHRTPMAVWRNGAAARAVDMMDNARALPTCPQPQQQQQTDFLAA